MLTRRGWTLVLAAGALAAAAALVGIQELYGLAVAAGALLAVSAASVLLRSWSLHTERHLQPLRVAAGGVAHVELQVRNDGSRRSPVLGARDPFDNGRRAASFMIAPLDPGEADRATYRLPTGQRGVFTLGPLELTLSDPLGLLAVARVGAPASTLIVHPRVDDVQPPRVSAGTDRRSGDGSSVVGAHGDEFYALRTYRTGDDLRRVHWSATARTGELMIRQEESEHRGRVTLALDLRERAWRPAALEVALSAVASVGAASSRAGLEVRLVHTGGGNSGFAGPGRRPELLDELAVARTHRDSGEPLARQLRRAGVDSGDGALVVFTSDFTPDGEVAGLARSARHARLLTTVVIDCARRSSPSEAPRSAAALVRVPSGGRFADEWDRVAGHHQRDWTDG